jgi:hypothetical protein
VKKLVYFYSPTTFFFDLQAVEIKKSNKIDIPLPHIKWARRFLKKYPDIVLRKGTPMEKDRRVGGSVQVVSEHFDKFESAVQKGGFLASLVYNYDETPLINKTEKPPKLLAGKFSKFVFHRKDNIITSCTCAPCIAADGGHATTALAYPGSMDLTSLKKQLHNSTDFAHYNTPNGSFTVDSFDYHVRHRLLPDFKRRRKEMEDFIAESSPEVVEAMLHSASYYTDCSQCDNCKKVLHQTGFLHLFLLQFVSVDGKYNCDSCKDFCLCSDCYEKKSFPKSSKHKITHGMLFIEPQEEERSCLH